MLPELCQGPRQQACPHPSSRGYGVCLGLCLTGEQTPGLLPSLLSLDCRVSFGGNFRFSFLPGIKFTFICTEHHQDASCRWLSAGIGARAARRPCSGAATRETTPRVTLHK